MCQLGQKYILEFNATAPMSGNKYTHTHTHTHTHTNTLYLQRDKIRTRMIPSPFWCQGMPCAHRSGPDQELCQDHTNSLRQRIIQETTLKLVPHIASHTLIRKNFVVKKFSSRTKRRKILLVILHVHVYIANIIWHVFDMNENIVTRKFLTQKFANKNNANYNICTSKDLITCFIHKIVDTCPNIE